MSAHETYDYTLKIILMGDSAVGKSSLISRFCKNQFELNKKATIGVEFLIKTLTIDGKKVKANIWDTAGQERFKSITSAYYRGAVGALLVYDLTKGGSFDNITNWVQEMQNHSDPEIQVVLCGNKLDLAKRHRAVTTEMGRKLAEKLNFAFIETSALDASNVEYAFEMVCRSVIEKINTHRELRKQRRNDIGQSREITVAVGHQGQKEKNCCFDQ